MSDRRRNHFIPRFILKRFASKRKKEKSWIWQLSRDSKAEISTKDAAVAADFYGGSETGVEDMFESAEKRFSRSLTAIEGGDLILGHAETLRELVWTLAVRTRALREQFAGTFSQFLGTAIKSLESNSVQEVIVEHMRSNWDRLMGDALSGLPKIAHLDARSFLGDPDVKEDLRCSAEKLLPMLAPALLSRFCGGINNQDALKKISEEGQIKGLKTLLGESRVPETFSPSSWQLYNVESQDLILGDGCVVAVGADGSVGSLLRSDIAWKAVYLPISVSTVLVAMREGSGALLSARDINIASATLSSSYIYASKVNDFVLEMAQIIGKGEVLISGEKVAEIVAESWNDLGRSN